MTAAASAAATACNGENLPALVQPLNSLYINKFVFKNSFFFCCCFDSLNKDWKKKMQKNIYARNMFQKEEKTL